MHKPQGFALIQGTCVIDVPHKLISKTDVITIIIMFTVKREESFSSKAGAL